MLDAFAEISAFCSGNTSAFAPEHLLNLWLSKRLAGGFRLAGGVRWVDDQFIAEDNVTSIDPVAVRRHSSLPVVRSRHKTTNW